MAPDTTWPSAPAIYQIYPRSFRDTRGTGVGTLDGITQKLDHVAKLGVDAIWLSPFYPSPMSDGGYDVADHCNVHPMLGTLDDFDKLVRRAHDLGLRVVIDQVFNHTSKEAPWFARSVARDPYYDEFYVWCDPKPDGTAPNNWLSQFGPPAWTWNHIRRQYYFHNFTAEQPSLNLRCENVKAEMRKIMRFWRDRGVDGFRIDAITSFVFNTEMADNPPATPEVQDRVSGENFVPYTYQDHVHDILPGDGLDYVENIRDWAGSDAFLLGEVTSGNQSVELACGLTQPGRLDAAYTTDLPERAGTAAAYADIMSRAEDPQALGWWLSSHDQPRHAGKSGDGSDRDVRFLSLMLAVSPGTVLVYQGEELGLCQPQLPKAAVTDPLDLLYWPDGPGREGARVPLPWAEGADRGFSTGRPWLPMDWASGLSVAVQEIAHDSNLRFYREIHAFRRDKLRGRKLQGWRHEGEVIGLDYDCAEVVLNFGTDPVEARPDPDIASGEMEGGTLPGRTGAIWLR
ncbi:alpha-amylase family glycosyl hydrolase [Jannaschia ovalis]|uniref:Alpha-amylase family glycosyl hydrolase n=1 Tax=Jannaschia ovalis TaxID=3038773 RepID=A0ABY8LDU0_9RHOB|nr:alpha-amylase family glycosyl hydrolase [Jannaschia sp. GRR-S6-38]WGH79474.1 alpha-amylase family glycosyl hydrolase [Jannaschia sp. GRR-S6-38]